MVFKFEVSKFWIKFVTTNFRLQPFDFRAFKKKLEKDVTCRDVVRTIADNIITGNNL